MGRVFGRSADVTCRAGRGPARKATASFPNFTLGVLDAGAAATHIQNAPRPVGVAIAVGQVVDEDQLGLGFGYLTKTELDPQSEVLSGPSDHCARRPLQWL